VLADFARQLERELSRALKLAEDNGKLAHQTACELAEARDQRDEWDRIAHEKLSELVIQIERANKAEKQRDTLAESLRFYADVRKYPAPLTGGMGDLWIDCGSKAAIALATLNP